MNENNLIENLYSNNTSTQIKLLTNRNTNDNYNSRISPNRIHDNAFNH